MNPVPKHRALEIFTRIAGKELEAAGFAPRKDGVFAKQANSDVIQLIELVWYRTAYTVKWGASLGFVPYEWKGKPKWSRRVASARFSILEIGNELEIWDGVRMVRDPDGTERWRFMIPHLHGEGRLAEEMTRSWAAEGRAILPWLDRVAVPEGVLAEADRQITRGKEHHWPPAPLVRAFTLARLGHADRGRSELETLIENDQYGDLQPHDGLRATLFSVADSRE